MKVVPFIENNEERTKEMGYSVELYFDTCSENKFRELWRELHELGISKFMHESGGRPHIALVIFDEDDCDLNMLRQLFHNFFMKKDPLELIFSSIGIFPSEEGVTYAGVKPIASLLDLQEDFYNRVKDTSLASQVWAYYTPEYWVPHCTMTIGTTAEEQLMAVDLLRRRFRNIIAKTESVALVKFYPYELIDEIHLKG